MIAIVSSMKMHNKASLIVWRVLMEFFAVIIFSSIGLPAHCSAFIQKEMTAKCQLKEKSCCLTEFFDPILESYH